MGEIKSAIELAMERTQGLRLSKVEREKLKDEEIHARAQGLLNRFLGEDFHLREVEKELAKHDPEERRQMEQLFLASSIEALDLDRDPDLILQGIGAFRPAVKEALTGVKDLFSRYQGKRKSEREKTEEELREKLERLGVGGSAVRPRVEGSPEWQKALAGFKPAFEKELQSRKEGLQG